MPSVSPRRRLVQIRRLRSVETRSDFSSTQRPMAKDFERWLIGHAVEIDGVPGLSVARLREDARRFGTAAGEAGQQCLAEWLATLGR